MRRVMVFGVFDGLHDGHRDLFEQAKKHGGHLVAVVTQDHIVEYLKGHLPRKCLAERIEDLEKEKLVDEVALGDAELSSYEVLKRHRPDTIVLGYDQEEFKKDLNDHAKEFDWRFKIVVAKPREPEKYKSSILNK